MSCGKHHETDCSEVLQRAYEYIDGELGEPDCAKIKVHLDECAGCLDEYHRDELLKALIRRSCGCDAAPDQLRTRILATLVSQTTQISASGEFTQTTVQIQYDA